MSMDFEMFPMDIYKNAGKKRHKVSFFLSSWIFALLCVVGALMPAAAQVKTFAGKKISVADMDKFLRKQMDSLGLPAVSIAIINESKVTYHRAMGVMDVESRKKIDNETLFEAASTSKPVFAYLVMKTVERGLLDLDKPLYQYLAFPELENDERYKLVTARMVLAHSTGFPNWRWLDPVTGNWSGDNKMFMLHAPGTFSYSGEAYHYLAKVVAHLRGVTLQELDSIFRLEVATPLGMKNAYFSWNDHMGRNKATGYEGDKVIRDKWESADAMYADSTVFGAANGLHTEAVSYANFLIALMDNRGLKKATIDEMLKIHTRIPDNELPNYGPIKGWGLGFAVEPSDRGTRFSHSGYNPGFVAFFMFDREHKNGYVFFTNSVDKAGVLEAHLRKFLDGGR